VCRSAPRPVWIYEGLLSFVTDIFCTYRNSTHKREWGGIKTKCPRLSRPRASTISQGSGCAWPRAAVEESPPRPKGYSNRDPPYIRYTTRRMNDSTAARGQPRPLFLAEGFHRRRQRRLLLGRQAVHVPGAWGRQRSEQPQASQPSRRSWHACGRRVSQGALPIWRGAKGPVGGSSSGCRGVLWDPPGPPSSRLAAPLGAERLLPLGRLLLGEQREVAPLRKSLGKLGVGRLLLSDLG
jgi:hypothetical protein